MRPLVFLVTKVFGCLGNILWLPWYHGKNWPQTLLVKIAEQWRAKRRCGERWKCFGVRGWEGGGLEKLHSSKCKASVEDVSSLHGGFLSASAKELAQKE